MAKLVVVKGALLMCSEGTAPSTLNALTEAGITLGGATVASVLDHAPGVHVMPFGTCRVKTRKEGKPCPCALPETPSPWTPGETAIALQSSSPLLAADATLACVQGGTISIADPGQAKFVLEGGALLTSSSTPEGDPVDVATGRVFTSAVDLEFPDVPGLTLTRTYCSNNPVRPATLGLGWFSLLDCRLALYPSGLLFRDREGRTVPLLDVSPGGVYTSPEERLQLRRVRDLRIIVHAGGAHLHFDEQGQLTQARNRRGDGVHFHRSAGVVRELETDGGARFELRYDASGALAAILAVRPDATEPVPVARYERDVQGRLIAVHDARGSVSRYSYDARHRLVRKTARDGYDVHFEYDADGRCVRTWCGDGSLPRQLRYDVARGTTEVTDARGAKKTYAWNREGLVVARTDALGHQRRYEFDEQRRLVRRSDELGRETRFIYDAAGNLTTQVTADGHTRTFAGAAGHVEVDDGGGPVQFHCDVEGRPVAMIDAERRVRPLAPPEAQRDDPDDALLGLLAPRLLAGLEPASRRAIAVVAASEYDAEGRVVAEQYASGLEVRCERDAAGCLVRTVEPGGTTTYAFDGEQRMVSVTDALGYTRGVVRHGLGQRLEHRDENGATSRAEYDLECRLTCLVNPKGESHSFTYDPCNRVIADETFCGRRRGYAYDPCGNLVGITEADGAAVRLTYDRGDHLVAVTATDAAGGVLERSYRYAAGRMIEARAADAVVTFAYDSLGRVIAEQQGSVTIERSYDRRGKLVRQVGPCGATMFSWDEDGRLTEMVLPGGAHLRLVRNDWGQIVEHHLPGEVICVCSYDAYGRPASQEVTRRGERLGRRECRYDARGQAIRYTDTRRGGWTYTYDRASQLTAVTGPGGATRTYAYDLAGNLTHVDGEAAVVGRGNRLHALAGWSYAYDARGSVVRRARGTDAYLFRHDALGQMIAATDPTGRTTRYTYDALGRRVVKATDGLPATTYVWDLHQLAGELMAGAATEYVYYPAGFIPLAQINGSRARCCVSDQRGSTLELVDEDGEVVWSGEYEAFGACRVRAAPGVVYNLRRPGQYYDAETGLLYNYTRYYDPQARRYLSQDIYSHGSGELNHYVYARNDPVNRVDPLGLAPVAAIGAYELMALGGAAIVGGGTAVAIHHANENGGYPGFANPLDAVPNPFDLLDNPFETSSEPEVIVRAKPSKDSGKSKANDIPGWQREHLGGEASDEPPAEAADRVMRERYPDGHYPKGPGSEYQKLKKYLSRGGRGR